MCFCVGTRNTGQKKKKNSIIIILGVLHEYEYEYAHITGVISKRDAFGRSREVCPGIAERNVKKAKRF